MDALLQIFSKLTNIHMYDGVIKYFSEKKIINYANAAESALVGYNLSLKA